MRAMSSLLGLKTPDRGMLRCDDESTRVVRPKIRHYPVAWFLKQSPANTLHVFWHIHMHTELYTSCFQGVTNGQPYTAYRLPLDTHGKR